MRAIVGARRGDVRAGTRGAAIASRSSCPTGRNGSLRCWPARSSAPSVVPVNPRLNYHELKYQLRHAEVSAAFTAEQYDGIDFLQYFEDVIAELPDLQYLVTVGDEELWYDDRIFRFEDLVSSGEGRRLPEPSSAGDDSDLALLYTSGTMGKPKGVRLSHCAVIETAVTHGRRHCDGPRGSRAGRVPLFTIFGFGVVVGAVAVGRDARAPGRVPCA